MITYPPLESKKGFPLLSQNRQFQWFSNPTLMFPLIPASAATLLKSKRYDVIWKDGIAEGMDYEKYLKFIEKKAPDIVAIETKTPVIKYHWKIINNLKEILPETKFLLMGDHVTALPKESLEKCQGLDFVITGGDYDFSLLELSEYLEGKRKPPNGLWYRKGKVIKNTGNFQLNHDLNSLPFIDRELTQSKLYNVEYNMKGKPFEYTMAGRDCPYHRCRFCAWTTLFPLFRVRTPENLLDEIGMLIEKRSVKEIFDDTGTFPPSKWLEKFCNGMISRGYNEEIYFSCNMRVDYITEENAKLMKKAGFRLLKIGLESANQKTLDRINKGIRVEQITEACKKAKRAGLEIHLTMIVGYPWETKKEALNTFKLAKKLMTSGLADVLQSTVLIPYPGTPLWKEGLEKNWFRFNPEEYERYDMTEPVFKTPDMGPEEVMEICDSIYKIFLSPEYILRHMIKIKSWDDIRYTFRGVKAVIGHLRDFSRKPKG